MKFHVEGAEYIGLLRIKSVVEAALRSRDHWISEVGYAKMFELIQKEVEAYYTATGQPVPQFPIISVIHNTFVQEKTDGKD